MSTEIHFDALDINKENVYLSLSYSFTINDINSKNCYFKTEEEINDKIVRTEIRSHFRHKASKMEKEQIKDIDIELFLNELNNYINNSVYIFGEGKVNCNIYIRELKIIKVKYN